MSNDVSSIYTSLSLDLNWKIKHKPYHSLGYDLTCLVYVQEDFETFILLLDKMAENRKTPNC